MSFEAVRTTEERLPADVKHRFSRPSRAGPERVPEPERVQEQVPEQGSPQERQPESQPGSQPEPPGLQPVQPHPPVPVPVPES